MTVSALIATRARWRRQARPPVVVSIIIYGREFALTWPMEVPFA